MTRTIAQDASPRNASVPTVIARGLSTHPLTPNPKRQTARASFDDLGGNTTLSILLTEFGQERVGHRHFDEATTFIVAGRGRTEVRPRPDGPATTIHWSAGDVFAIPSNAWHQHYGDPPNPARQLTFKSTALMNSLFQSRALIRENDFEFEDRYGDEATWSRAVRLGGLEGGDGATGIPHPPLLDRPDLGSGVRAVQLPLAGQRLLETWLVDVPAGGQVGRHRHLVEEVFVVLEGEGQTTLVGADGSESIIEWAEGDLVSPPLAQAHGHVAQRPGARLLLIRSVFVELAIGGDRAEMWASTA